MSRWVDFQELRQSMSIEQVLTSYHVPLKRVGLHQLRGPCPLPTHSSERSRESFSVDTARNVWACHSATCCEARQGRVGGKFWIWWRVWRGCSLRQAALRLQEECRGTEWRWGSRNGLQKEAPRAEARIDPIPYRSRST
jgi:hypothetical protein